MMSQVNPGQLITIVRQLDNVADPATYYLQAVVAFSNTGKVYKTINLTNKGSQRFVGQFNAPTDGTMGTQIDITTYIYTDSGYTQLSPVYSTTNDVVLVAQLFSTALGFGAGSDGLSPEMVRAIIREEMKGIPAPVGLELEDINGHTDKSFSKYFDMINDNLGNLKKDQEEIRIGHEKSLGNMSSEIKGYVTRMLNDHSDRHKESLVPLLTETKKNKRIMRKVKKDIAKNHEDFRYDFSNKVDSLFSRLTELENEKKTHKKDMVEFKRKIKDNLLKSIDNDIEIQEEKEPAIDFKAKALRLLNQ